MFNALRDFLKIQQLNPETIQILRGLLSGVAIVMVLAAFFAAAVALFTGDRTVIPWLIRVGVVLLASGVAGLLRRGRVLIALMLFCLGLWLAVVGGAVFLGGIYIAGLSLLSIVVLLVGLFAGVRAGLLNGLVSCLTLVALYLLHAAGRLPAWSLSTLGADYLLVYLLGFLITAAVTIFARWRMDKTLADTAARTRDLALANGQLQREIQERTRAGEAEIRQRQVADTLRAAAQLLTSTLDREDVLAHILEMLETILDYDSVAVVLLSSDGVELAARRGPGRTTTAEGRHWPRALPLQQLVIDSRAPVYVADTHTDSRWSQLPTGSEIGCWLGIPLIAQETVVGLMSLTHRIAHHYDQQQIDTAVAFASQAAMTIENARLYQASQRQAQQLTTLYEATVAISGTLDIQELLRLLHHQCETIKPIDIFGVALFDMVKSELYIPYMAQADGQVEDVLGMRFPVEKAGLANWVLSNGLPLMIDDTTVDPLPGEPMLVVETSPRSWLGIPFVARGESIGLMTLQSHTVRYFSDADQRLYQTLANQFAGAVAGARLFDLAQNEIAMRRTVEEALRAERALLAQRVEERTAELQRQYRWQAALASLEPTINHPRELSAILQRIVELTMQETEGAFGAAIVALQQVVPIASLAAGDYAIVAYATMAPLTLGAEAWRSSGAIGKIVAGSEVVILHDVETDEWPTSRWFSANRFRGYAGVPLRWQDVGQGVLFVFSRQPFYPSAETVDFLQALANRAAVSIANVNVFHALEEANRELARVAQLKDEFLASMSHELRTPLNAILGLSESLEDGVYEPLTQRQRRAVQNIGRSGQHLLALINDILDVSKIEAGKMDLTPESVTVATVCAHSIDFVRPAAQKKALTIDLTVAPEVDTMLADKRRLTQILINLLGNAVKFTPTGGSIGLRVSRCDDTDRPMICFDVWDTGIGIAHEDVGRLFDSFVQLDSRLAREYEGSGLGLALVKHMTLMHGGTVTVTSQMGHGSCFTVTLPIDGPPSTLNTTDPTP